MKGLKPVVITRGWPMISVLCPTYGTSSALWHQHDFLFSGQQTCTEGLRHILKHLHAIVRGETPPIYKGTEV